MKKYLLLFAFLITSCILNAQIPVEFSIQGRGSDINGLLGAELQISNFGLSGSWRPMNKSVNSYIATITKYFNNIFDAYPYFSVGYSSKGYGYTDIISSGYDEKDKKFTSAVFFLAGFKSIIYGIANDRLSGRGGLGLTISDKGQMLSFELSINYVLFGN